jgi:dynein heavy chain
LNSRTGGDIAKQMPLEAKKFLKVDRDFVKLMNKAESTQIVLNCCANELLKNTLPVLYDELERCVSRRPVLVSISRCRGWFLFRL